MHITQDLKDLKETDMYFVPNLPEIYIGYECEIRSPKYEGKKFIIYEDQMQYAVGCIRAGILFTPYLTKEQIEAEGWTSFGKCAYSHPDGYILIIDQYLIEIRNSIILFHGECKDINTFRYITKLLRI